MSRSRSLLSLAPLFFVIMLDTMGIGLIIPVAGPLFMAQSGGVLWPDASLATRNILYGVALGIFSLTMLIGAPLLGDLSDILGRKKVLIIGLLVSCVAYFIGAIGINFHMVSILILSRFISGFSAGSQPIAQAAIADVSNPNKKAVNMALMTFMACLGFIAGPIIGGYFANSHILPWFTFATPFYVATILAFVNAVAVILFFKETYVPQRKNAFDYRKGLLKLVLAFKDTRVKKLLQVLLLLQTGFAIFFMYISLYLTRLFHFSTTAIGHYLAYVGIIWAITFIFIMRLADKYLSLDKIMLFSLMIGSAALLGVIFSNQVFIWLIVIPLAISNGLTYTSMLALLSNAVDKESQGWVMGVASAVVAAAWGVGSLTAGVVGAVHIHLPFIIAAWLTLTALLVFLRRNSRNKS